MKTMILGLSFLASLSAFGSTYRQYDASLVVANGEIKTFTMNVNPNLRVDTYGEPEIGGHGFYDYMAEGTIIENGKECDFDLLLTQGHGEEQTTDAILRTGNNRGGSLKLCSGLRVSISSVRSLLTNDAPALPIQLFVPGLSKPMGQGLLRFIGVMETPIPADIDD